MSDKSCDRCAQLEREIAKLRRENDRLRQAVDRARGICYYWLYQCQRVQVGAQQVLCQPSGVKRAVWGFNRGVDGGVQVGIDGLGNVLAELEIG